MSDASEVASTSPTATVGPKIRWFRRWWATMPLNLIFIMSAFLNPLIALAPFLLLMIVIWSGPVTMMGKAGKFLGWKMKSFITVFGLGLIAFVLGNQGAKLNMGGRIAAIPSCDSRNVVDLYKTAIKRGPGGVEVFELKQIREMRWDEERQVRVCAAQAFTSAGEVPLVAYQIKWMDRGKGQIWLETIN